MHEPVDNLKRCAHLVVGMLIGNPTRREAHALAWAPISDDPNELRAVQLAKPLSVVDLYKIARGRRLAAQRVAHRQHEDRAEPVLQGPRLGLFVARGGLWPFPDPLLSSPCGLTNAHSA